MSKTGSRRRLLAGAAAVVVVLGALAATGGLEHWPPSVFGLRQHAVASSARLPGGPATAIKFTSDQGVILTGPGSRYRLAAEVVDASGRGVPGQAVRWRSDDPVEVSVSSSGVVTAHVPVGSATITATAAGVQSQAAQVLIAPLAPRTVLIPTDDIVAVRPGMVTLRHTSQTAEISAGDTLVSNGRSGGGLLARVVSATAGASTVTAVTAPASLAGAFAALSVHVTSAPVTAAASATGTRTTAADAVTCKLASGATEPVSLQDPSVSVPATVQLSAVLDSRSGVVRQFELAAHATLPIIIRTGAVTLSAAGNASATCELAVDSIPVPTPVFLGPVEISGEVNQAAGVNASLRGGASLEVPGPTVSDTITALNGIEYSFSGGWRSLDQDQQSGITVAPGPGMAFRASLSASLSPFVRVGFGVAGTLAGDDLAGSSLAFAQAQGDYTLSIQEPFSYLTPGYTGPRWDTSLRLTAGPQIAVTGNLATLLQWAGITLPHVTWNLLNESVPLQSSPAFAVAVSPAQPGSKVIRLSAALPAAFNGDKAEFVQYPSRGGQGSVVATAAVTDGAAKSSWNDATPAVGTRVAALVFDKLYGAAGFPYASAASLAALASAGTWTAITAPLPPDAAAMTNQDIRLTSAACPAPATCMTAGHYGSEGTGGYHGLIDTLSGGTWTPTEVFSPSGGAADDQSPVLDGVSCPVLGACVAVGAYYPQGSASQPLIETLSDGTWTPAAAPLPAGAGTSDYDEELYAVACSAPGTCVATGGYGDQNGAGQALIENLSDGTWTPAEAPLPPGATSNPNANLGGVACPAPGTCVAAGSYGGTGGYRALIETLSNGTWTPANAPLPAGADVGAGSELNAVTCPSPGTCVAVGIYTGQDGSQLGLIDTLSDGTWTAAEAPSLPGGSAPELIGVACATIGTCVATGEYANQEGSQHGMFEMLSGGTWTPVKAPLPAGAAANGNAIIYGAACSATGTCVATGFYTDQGDNMRGLIETTQLEP